MPQIGDETFGYDEVSRDQSEGILKYRLLENGRYYQGDAEEVLDHLSERKSASLICLDDAWARPQRNGEFGVDYDTHDIEKTKDIIDSSWEMLEDGGWIIFDADDWLLPRLINYIREEHGDVAETYEGGGYRRVGSVTYLTKDGKVNRGTSGEYLANGGYSVVFAHKGETDRKPSESARQTSKTPSPDIWGTPKPIGPYRAWVEDIMEPGELLVVPCAGTAPAAIGQIQAFGDDANYICIDTEKEAIESFISRRNQEVSRGSDATDW